MNKLDLMKTPFKNSLTRVTLGSGNFDVGTNTWTSIQWVVEIFDNNDVWVVSSPTRITIPNGFTKVNLKAYVPFVNSSTGYRYSQIRKNGTGNPIVMRAQAAQNETGLFMDTGWISCVAGDYFEVLANSSNGEDVLGSGTWGGSAWFEAEFR